MSFLATLTLLTAVQIAPATPEKVYAIITASRLIDGRTASAIENAVVVVSGNVIREARSKSQGTLSRTSKLSAA
jgi:hypothetical protein